MVAMSIHGIVMVKDTQTLLVPASGINYLKLVEGTSGEIFVPVKALVYHTAYSRVQRNKGIKVAVTLHSSCKVPVK